MEWNTAPILASIVIILTGAIALGLISRLASVLICRFTGLTGLLILGCLGTVLHEFSHLVFAIFFRHRIVEVKFFAPDLATGTLGYVSHSYSRNSLFQKVGAFFVGMAPLVGSTIFIYWLILPYFVGTRAGIPLENAEIMTGLTIQNASSYLWMLNAFLEKLKASPWTTLFVVFLGCSVALQAAPSRQDIKGALDGVWPIIFLTGIVSACSLAASKVGMHLPIDIWALQAATAAVICILLALTFSTVALCFIIVIVTVMQIVRALAFLARDKG